MNENPLISIITVSYNSAATIEKTIQHTLNQTYNKFEYILIDGGSKDGTMDIIRKYKPMFAEKGISYKFISERDTGVYDAMNKGVRMSSGELIGIINSDDWYELDALERVAVSYREDNSFDIYHGLLRFIDKNGRPDSVIGHYESVLDYAMLEHPTCFVKSDCYKHLGLFDLTYTSASDYEWMLRARSSNRRFFLISHLIANFRRGGLSDSHIGVVEKLNIKRKYGLFSRRKWICLRGYHSMVPIVKRLMNLSNK